MIDSRWQIQDISIQPYTLENCHDFYLRYVADPLMTNQVFHYDSESVDSYYKSKISDPNRRVFGVFLYSEVVGEIQLKKINYQKQTATLSIILANDKYKNLGIGTQAERLILGFAKISLGLSKIFADTTSRNLPSKRVLEKVGFKYMYDELDMSYFEIDLDDLVM